MQYITFGAKCKQIILHACLSYSAQLTSDYSSGLVLFPNNALYKPCWTKMSNIWHCHIAKSIFFPSNLSISNLIAAITLGASDSFKGGLFATLAPPSSISVVDISNYYIIISMNKSASDTKLLY
ncbi:hypothetical protein LguiA_034276 [Lonicera macranthoides]